MSDELGVQRVISPQDTVSPEQEASWGEGFFETQIRKLKKSYSERSLLVLSADKEQVFKAADEINLRYLNYLLTTGEQFTIKDLICLQAEIRHWTIVNIGSKEAIGEIDSSDFWSKRYQEFTGEIKDFLFMRALARSRLSEGKRQQLSSDLNGFELPSLEAIRASRLQTRQALDIQPHLPNEWLELAQEQNTHEMVPEFRDNLVALQNARTPLGKVYAEVMADALGRKRVYYRKGRRTVILPKFLSPKLGAPSIRWGVAGDSQIRSQISRQIVEAKEMFGKANVGAKKGSFDKFHRRLGHERISYLDALAQREVLTERIEHRSFPKGLLEETERLLTDFDVEEPLKSPEV